MAVAKRNLEEIGEFTGAFASYGYMKDTTNNNKLLVDPEYCRICRTHGAVSATAAAQTKKNIKKAKKVVDESVSLQYNTNRSIHWAIAKW